MSKFFKFTLILSILIGIVFFLYYNWYWSDLGPKVVMPEAIEVNVKEGDGLYKAIKYLEKDGLIKNNFMLKIKIKFMSLEPVIQPGIYRFVGEQRPKDLLNVLLSGDILKVKMTIPEGFNIYQIAEKLATSGLREQPQVWLDELKKTSLFKKIPGEALSLEGYLFPDTYEHSAVAKPQAVVARMVDQFFTTLNDEVVTQAAKHNLNLHQLVTLASIIEKETSVGEERRRISGVFHNRMRIGMRLQTDPTVIYGLLPNYLGRIRKVDLITPSPYNTYTLRGLPPGPIANPGLASLKAAADPLDTQDLYFVSRGDGTHHFSKTLSEHNAAVRKYQLGKD